MKTRRSAAIAAGLALTMLGPVGCEDEPEVGAAGDLGNGIAPDRQIGLVANQQAVDGEDVEVTEASGLGALEVQRQLPETIYANQPFQYVLIVKNTSEMTLHDIRLRELYRGQLRAAGQPQGQQTQQAQGQQQQGQQQQQAQGQQQGQQQIYGFPAAQQMPADQGQVHQLGMLGPGETREIQATAVPTTDGQLKLCVLADYAMAQCSTIDVIQPELQLQRRVVNAEGNPIDRAFACEEIFVVYAVRNAGTGETGQVIITEPLSSGFQTAEGQSRIQLQLDGLEGGETVTTDPVRIVARQGGMFGGTATAKTDRLQATAGGNDPIQIMRPQIAMRMDGPRQQFLGRAARYTVSVRNTSQFPAPETQVALELPENIDRLSVSTQQIERDGETFNLGTLEPGETRSFSVEFEPTDVGQLTLTGQATAYCAADANAQVVTAVQGVPALQIEAVDARDPVDVGGQTTYDIVVINEGTARDTTIKLTGQLGPGLEFVGAEGSSQVQMQNGTLNFGTIESLEPGEDATWTVTVRGTSATRSRLSLELQSGAIRRPVREVEPTNVF